MPDLDIQAYGPLFADLLNTDRNRELGPGSPVPERYRDLKAMSVEDAFAHAVLADRDMARLCLSGVWLLYDFLDESHAISQQVATASGSYWHGIMHRREPDYGNAKYWFRRVQQHPVFEPLHAAAGALAHSDGTATADRLAGQTAWDPLLFIDACEEAARGRSDGESFCRQVAQREWELLFDHCYRRAIAGAARSEADGRH